MAILITNANANINDTTLTYTLTYSGVVGTSRIGSIIVNGVTIGSSSATSSTSSVSVTITKTALYDAATGSSLSGAVTFRVTDLNGETVVGSSSKTGGTITINGRLSSFTSSTANPYNLDSITNIVTSWARPHTAFRGRLTVSVYNGSSYVDCFTRSGFNTSTNFSPNDYAGYVTAMITAMNSASPRNIRFTLETGFVADSTIYYTSSNPTPITNTNGVIKSFAVVSNISSPTTISLNLDTSVNTTLPFTINRNPSTLTHSVYLEYEKPTSTWNVLLTLTGVGASGTFTFTEGNLTTLFSNFTTTSTIPLRIRLVTFNGAENLGTTYVTGNGTIINADPTIGTSTYSDLNTALQTILTATSPVTLLQLKSQPRITAGATTFKKSATLKNYRVRIGANTVTSATTTLDIPSSYLNFTSNTLVYVDVIDSRDKIATFNLTLTVLPYTSPNVASISAYRNNNYDAQTYLEITFDVQSLIVSTQKNVAKLRWRLQNNTTGVWGSYTNITNPTATTSGGRLLYTVNTANRISLGSLDQNTSFTLEIGRSDNIEATHVLSATINIGIGVPVLRLTKTGAVVGGTLDVNGAISEGGTSLASKYLLLSDVTEADTGSKVVRRHASGYIYATYFNQSSAAETSVASHYMYQTGTDGFIRKKTLANVRTEIVTTAAVEAAYILAEGTSGGQYWIKYSDGTLIKWGTYNLTSAIATAFGNAFVSGVNTVTFNTTVPFSAIPVITMSSTDGTGNQRTSIGMLNGISATAFTYQLGRFTSQASQTWFIGWQAIGRWA